MTYDDYKLKINQWAEIADKAGLTLSTGKPLPITFWKTFLGLKRKVHQDMYNGTHNTISKTVPKYTVRSIGFASRLPENVFIDMVKEAIPEFEQDKTS